MLTGIIFPSLAVTRVNRNSSVNSAVITNFKSRYININLIVPLLICYFNNWFHNCKSVIFVIHLFMNL